MVGPPTQSIAMSTLPAAGSSLWKLDASPQTTTSSAPRLFTKSFLSALEVTAVTLPQNNASQVTITRAQRAKCSRVHRTHKSHVRSDVTPAAHRLGQQHSRRSNSPRSARHQQVAAPDNDRQNTQPCTRVTHASTQTQAHHTSLQLRPKFASIITCRASLHHERTPLATLFQMWT